ncbi:MAG: ATP-binding protein [Coriobacteriia bacterium]|nr:ATP-binding protein [Coriobacteriia bacterium]
MFEHLRGKFATKLSAAFALIAVITAFLVVIASYLAWTHQFNHYVRQNLNDIASFVSTVTADAYARHNGWDFSHDDMLLHVAFDADIRILIIDNDGEIVYDDLDLRQRMREALAADEDQSAFILLDDTSASIYDLISQPMEYAQQVPVYVNDEVVGQVIVYTLNSSGLLSQRDLALRSASFWTMVGAGVAATILASFAGRIYAQLLVRPIQRIADTARTLRKGTPSARTGLSGDDEIDQLGEVFDAMADSIEADRELERRLTGDVAHELRTPLMSIQATVECIEDGIYAADYETLGIIQTEVRRLTRLTNVILELSRLETGSLPFSMERIDLATPLLSAADASSALFESLELYLQTYVRDGLYVVGDAERLQQAIGNLLGNAARYTPKGGTVTLAAYEEDSWIVVQVSDTGIGISQENLEHLFKRFWRADAARARATGGIGVGLSITKEIIDRHKGHIEIESEENKGTTFRVFLPKSP